MDSTLLKIQNPWWVKRDSIESDSHLVKVLGKPYFFAQPLVESQTFNPQDFHIVRGPRQVGKTTLLKQWIKRLLRSNEVKEQSVFYLSCEGIAGFSELESILIHWLSARQTERTFLFLDEISFVHQWQRGILALINAGLLQKSSLTVTGSNARDLKESSERFPGRRGGGKDVSIYPLSPLELRQIPFFSKLENRELMKTYLQIGGFPHAIRDFVTSGQINDETYKTYQNWILGDAAHFNLTEEVLKHTFFRIAETCTSRVTWPDLIKNTPIKSHETGLQYTEYLEEAFLCHTVHCYDEELNGPAIHKSRKIYLIDPLLYHLAYAWKLGIINIWTWVQESKSTPDDFGKMLEATYLNFLKRKRSSVYFWYSSKSKKEVDILLNEKDGIKLFECKWKTQAPYQAMNRAVEILTPDQFFEFGSRFAD